MTTGSQQALELKPRAWWAGLVRPKGYLGPVSLSVLIVVACVPLAMVVARILAFPGIYIPEVIGGDLLRVPGSMLNESLSLEWIPPSNRWAILYLLLLPTGAMLIAVARLTFGLRILGIRSILLAVGLQEIGFLPTLGLLAIIVAIVIVIRPAMRRIGLPLYARLAVLLCMVATVMVGALFLGSWLRSEAVWGVAFFPVIILAMMAEQIGKTLNSENALAASWRLGWTILVALVIALISQNPAVREFALHFPELMLTQLAAIIFISEFLDLRLLENWQSNLIKMAGAAESQQTQRFKVAVVRNRWNVGVIGRLGVSAPAKSRIKSVQPIVDALRDKGFTVRVFEGDTSLLRELRSFLPPDPRTGEPGGLVLNLATGVQGKGRFCHLPSMLEMSGVAYTGADPLGHARVLDRHVLMTSLRHAGVAIPRFKIMAHAFEDMGDLHFPLVVRPRYEPDQGRAIVNDHAELDAAIQRVVQRYAQEAFVEALVDGTEFRVSLLGNHTIECLPLLQCSSKGNRRICPAPISKALEEQLRECAYNAYAAAGCRDYARIDIRLSKPNGEPMVVEVNWSNLLARRGSFAQSAEAAGYSFADLLHRIVDEAWVRYDAALTMRAPRVESHESSIHSLSDRRVVAR